MKNKTVIVSILLAAVGASSLYAASPSKTNGKLSVVPLAPEDMSFTGKPYNKHLQAYLFSFRNYNPELSRWTTIDPSGFPNGANNNVYAPVPTSQIDPLGLETYTKSMTWFYSYKETGGQPSPWNVTLTAVSVTGGFTLSGALGKIATMVGVVGGYFPASPSNLELIKKTEIDGDWSPGEPEGEFVSLSITPSFGEYQRAAWHSDDDLDPGDEYIEPEAISDWQEYFANGQYPSQSEWDEYANGVPYPGSPDAYNTTLITRYISIDITLELE